MIIQSFQVTLEWAIEHSTIKYNKDAVTAICTKLKLDGDPTLAWLPAIQDIYGKKDDGLFDGYIKKVIPGYTNPDNKQNAVPDILDISCYIIESKRSNDFRLEYPEDWMERQDALIEKAFREFSNYFTHYVDNEPVASLKIKKIKVKFMGVF